MAILLRLGVKMSFIPCDPPKRYYATKGDFLNIMRMESGMDGEKFPDAWNQEWGDEKFPDA